MDEQSMAVASPPQLRFAEAEYFYSQFLKNCGPPKDYYFLMVCYFDSFLFALISIEEMVSAAAKNQLRACSKVRFLKALRNISSHHSVLGAALADSKFPRPFSRVISISIGGAPNNSSRLRLRFDVLRSIFDAVEKERPREAKTLEFARTFLQELENQGVKEVFLEELMAQGLESVRDILSRCHPPTGDT